MTKALSSHVFVAASVAAGATACTGSNCRDLGPEAMVITVVERSSGARICDATVVATSLENGGVTTLPQGYTFKLPSYGSSSTCVYTVSIVPTVFVVNVSRSGYEPASVQATSLSQTVNGCSFIPSDSGLNDQTMVVPITKLP
jgi:hypothetical protein